MWRLRLSIFAAALWWGGTGVIGFLVVPLLFAHLPAPALAGRVAATLFSAQTWLALGCGLVLLLALRRQTGFAPARRSDVATVFVLAGMILALLAEFAVAPRIVARENLKLWHGVGSALYFLQWLCAGATLWRASSHARQPAAADQV